MSDFNKIFKDAIDGYEVPFDHSVWEKLSGQLDPLEDAVRDAVEGHEAPYNPQAWKAVKSQLGGSSTALNWVIGSAAAVGLFFGVSTFFNNAEQDQTNTPLTTTKTISSIGLNSERHNYSAIIKTKSPLHQQQTFDNQDDQNENNLPFVINDDDTYVEEFLDDPITEPRTENITTSTTTTNTENLTNPTQTILEKENNEKEQDDLVVENEEKEHELDASFKVSSYAVCVSETILFVPKQTLPTNAGIQYNWNFGDQNSSSSSSVSHTYDEPGTYTITLSFWNKDHSILLAREEQTIEVNETPNADFEWNQDNELIPVITFEMIEAQQATNQIWKVNGQPVSDATEFSYTFREKGNYALALETKNENGCANTVEQEITIQKNYNLHAPSAFCPYGAPASNFMPRALEIMDVEFVMNIYNESGDLVFRTNNVNDPWNGINILTNAPEKNGQAYVWVVKLKNKSGIYETYTGQVFIAC